MSLKTEIMALPADLLGEVLRSMTFKGEGLGCYSNFEVRDDARPLAGSTVEWFWSSRPGYDSETVDDIMKNFDGAANSCQYIVETDGLVNDRLVINCCWFWDGDGVLCFDIFDPGSKQQRILVNTDCKKTHSWEDIT